MLPRDFKELTIQQKIEIIERIKTPVDDPKVKEVVDELKGVAVTFGKMLKTERKIHSKIYSAKKKLARDYERFQIRGVING